MQTFERACPVCFLMFGEIGGVGEPLPTKRTLVRLLIGVNRSHVRLVLGGRLEGLLTLGTFVWRLARVYSSVLFQRIFRLHIGVAMLTLIRLVMRMCLHMALELGLCGERLIFSALAASPVAAVSTLFILLETIDMISIDVAVEVSGFLESLSTGNT